MQITLLKGHLELHMSEAVPLHSSAHAHKQGRSSPPPEESPHHRSIHTLSEPFQAGRQTHLQLLATGFCPGGQSMYDQVVVLGWEATCCSTVIRLGCTWATCTCICAGECKPITSPSQRLSRQSPYRQCGRTDGHKQRHCKISGHSHAVSTGDGASRQGRVQELLHANHPMRYAGLSGHC